jgi:hypothetical protein
MGDLNSPCLVLFFADWKLNSRTKFAGACFGVVLAGVATEALVR